MLVMISRRLAQSVIVMLTVALIAFTLFRYVGKPISQMVGQDTPIQVREQMRKELGLNDPVVIQFAHFVGNTLRGRFGISYRIGRPVSALIIERLRSHFPKHGIVAEEGGGGRTESDYCWYVDPLDGTTNFAHGFPVFCVTLALA